MPRWPSTAATTNGSASSTHELRDLEAERDALELAWLEAADNTLTVVIGPDHFGVSTLSGPAAVRVELVETSDGSLRVLDESTDS